MISTLESLCSPTMLLPNKLKARRQSLHNQQNKLRPQSQVLNPILLEKAITIFHKPRILQFVLLRLLSREHQFLCTIQLINQVFSNWIRSSNNSDVHFRIDSGSYGFLGGKKHQWKTFGWIKMEELNWWKGQVIMEIRKPWWRIHSQ